MSERMVVLMQAARRAAELQADPKAHIAGAPTVLRGAPTHSGAALLRALEEQGWTVAPIPKLASDDIPNSVFVLLRDDDTIAGICRDRFGPPAGTSGWQVREYVDAPEVERLRKAMTAARALVAQAYAEDEDDSPGNLAFAVLNEALEGGEQHGA